MPYKNKEDANKRRRERYRKLSEEDRKLLYGKRKKYFAEWAKLNREKKNAWYTRWYCERDGSSKVKLKPSYYQPNRTRSRDLKRQYKLTLEEYQNLVTIQNNQCRICGIPANESRKGKLHVDHCHTTGVVRGLLCHLCNSGLGYFKDNMKSLQNAVTYLEANQ